MKSFLLVLFSICFFPLVSYPYSPGTTVFSFLKVNPSAKSSGLGQINSLISSQSMENNPSVLPWIGNIELGIQHMLYVADINYSMMSYLYPVNKSNAFGLTAGLLGVKGMTETKYDASSVDGYTEYGSLACNDMLLGIGYGKKTSLDFSYGLSAKIVSETIGSEKSTGIMVSGSILYDPWRKDWYLNCGLMNAGPAVKGYSLPLGGYIGIGKNIRNQFNWFGEIDGYVDTPIEFRTGVEYNYYDLMFFRIGYKHSSNNTALGVFPWVGLSCGMGFSYKMFEVDYGWVPYGDLGQTHRISIARKFSSEYVFASEGLMDNQAEYRNYQNGDARQSIAVADFRARNVTNGEAQTIAEFVREELSNIKSYNTLGRPDMEAALSQYKFHVNGCASRECAVKMARVLQIQYIIIGSLSRLIKTYYLNMDMVDVETGRIIRSVSHKAINAEELHAATRMLVNKLIQQ